MSKSEFKLEFKTLPGEQWYGGQVGSSVNVPVDETRVYENNAVENFGDQSTPFWVSNKGRYVWSEEGFVIKFDKGDVKCLGSAEIKLYHGHKSLRGAFLAASKAHFPPDGNMPDEMMFRVPQYCTWVEMFKLQSQRKILKYARGIIESGMPAGELIIDDGWQKDYGHWEFKERRFPDPKGMVDELHKMGFKVIMWCVPFVNATAPAFSELKEKNALVKDKDGNIAMRIWWDATKTGSAVLDYSSPDAVKWFDDAAKGLIDKYGVDGFKQDAGDNKFYRLDDITVGGISPNRQTELWVMSGLQFKFNEFRASWKAGGIGVAERLGDKRHKWDSGLRQIVQGMLNLGVTGHPFGCPDMIGGGFAPDFNIRLRKLDFLFDNELFIRWSQCATLMPMMQYSKALWSSFMKRTARLARAAALYHLEFSDYIVKYANAARKSGEPIVRYMEYNYPDEGLEAAKYQFMLGDDYLVAPVVFKGVRAREVMLPSGAWEYMPTGEKFEGGRTVTVPAPLEVLPVFKKATKD